MAWEFTGIARAHAASFRQHERPLMKQRLTHERKAASLKAQMAFTMSPHPRAERQCRCTLSKNSYNARCDDGYVTGLAAMPLCYALSGNAAGNGDVTCDNNVLRLYDGNVACLAAMPLVDVLCYVLSGNAADESDAA